MIQRENTMYNALRRSARLAAASAGPHDRKAAFTSPECHHDTAAKRRRTQPAPMRPLTDATNTCAAPVSAASTKGTADDAPTAAPQTANPSKSTAATKRVIALRPDGFGTLEQKLWKEGIQRIVGVDEAGRGPLAGPVVAAACSIPPGWSLPNVADSKTLNAAQRDELYDAIMSCPDITVTRSIVDASTIDEMNILRASLHAMQQCVDQLPENARGHVLVDGPYLPPGVDGTQGHAVIKGDSHCISIAAASIVAKVVRDRLMDELHEQYPQYDFK